MTSLELFDETLDINSTENYELAVQASPDGFTFSLLDTLRNKFVLIRSFEPDESKYFNSENIKEFISTDDFLTRSYKKTRIVMPSSKFTIVPAPLFDPAKKDEYFNFNLKSDNDIIVLSNKIAEPDAFIIFGVLKSFQEVIRTYFPMEHPCVHIMPLFENISRSRRNTHGHYLHVHIERDYFNLLIFSDKQLELCNTFRYRNVSDVLYYVLNAFGRLGIKQEETVHLSGKTEKFDELNTNLSTYVQEIKFAEPAGDFSFSYVFGEIQLHRFISLFSVLNCG